MHFLSGKPGAGKEKNVIIDRRILFGIVFGIALAADLVSKWAAFHFLRLHERVSVISGIFDFEPVWNPGIIFGIRAPIFVTIIVSIIATTVVIWYLRSNNGRAPVVQLYLGLILSGVIGNLVDRILYGAVRDFLLLYIRKNHWPNFNLADAFILVGVVLAMLQFILTEDKKEVKDGAEPGVETSEEAVEKVSDI